MQERKKRRRPVAAALWLGVASLALPGPLWAQESGSSPKPAPPDRAGSAAATATPRAADPFALPEEMRDPAFAQFVDLKLLGTAWSELDANLMADVALQLANGEEILQRSHKGVTARQVMEVAMQLAAETNRPDVMDRLIRAAKARNNNELASALSTTRKLASTSRADGPPPVALDQLSASELALVKAWSSKIKSVRLEGDRDALRELDGQIPRIVDLSDKQRQSLKNLVGEAIKSLPEGSSEKTAAGKLLDKLSAGSRPGPPVGDFFPGPGGSSNDYSRKFHVQYQIQTISIPGYTFQAARILSAPRPGSALDRIGVGYYDVITRLDGIPVNTPGEMDRHFGPTQVRFIKTGTTWVQEATVYLNSYPGGGGGGGWPGGGTPP